MAIKFDRVGKQAFPSALLLLLLALIALGSIAVALFYFENYLLLEPCPYCMLQRGIILLLALLLLVNSLLLWGDRGAFAARLFPLLIAIVVGFGLFVSGKHSWLQLKPGPNLGYCEQTTLAITEVFDYQIIKDLLSVEGDCSVIDWSFLGLSIPMWTFLLFLFLGVAGIYANWQKLHALKRIERLW